MERRLILQKFDLAQLANGFVFPPFGQTVKTARSVGEPTIVFPQVKKNGNAALGQKQTLGKVRLMSALPPRKRTLGLASLPALAELKALTASERASVIDAIAASALRGPPSLRVRQSTLRLITRRDDFSLAF